MISQAGLIRAPAAERHGAPAFVLERHMPRYFFHVEDGRAYTDLQGTELPDLAAARREAVRFAGVLLADKPDKFWGAGEWKLRVTDDRDLTLFTLIFIAIDSAAVIGM